MNRQRIEFKPFISPETIIPEFTFRAVITGIILGLIFGAVTVYLGLKVGMTISPQIPIAVISLSLFGLFYKLGLTSKKATILENNTVQTVGAAGESVAAGVIFTLPALIFLGFPLDILRIFLIALAGGLLGVCFLIPLRSYLIEREHGVLPYPESIACAEVLKSGEKGGLQAVNVFVGATFGFVYKILMGVLKFWKEIPSWHPKWYRGATITGELSPELLGVGYIIGPRTASIMVAGGFISWLVFIPFIKLFGGSLQGILYPGTKLISEMTPHEIWNSYIRYIGAGAVTAGGVIRIFKAFPTIINSFKASMIDLRTTMKNGKERVETKLRTKIDLPITSVIVGLIVVSIIIWSVLSFNIHVGRYGSNFVSTLLIIIFGFFFAVVSARLVGEIGVSSNPTSGMTIATLMATCLIFLAVGWKGGAYAAVALGIGAVVCISASNAGNVCQSLKTGYLLGATPRKQEYGYVIGILTSVLIVGFTVLAVNKWYTRTEPFEAPEFQITKDMEFEKQIEYNGKKYNVLNLIGHEKLPDGKYLVGIDDNKIHYYQSSGIGSEKLPAPQARLMSIVINGLLNQRLPWELVLLGVFITIAVELMGIRGLPFAVGVYLPLSTTAPIFIGGLIRLYIDKSVYKGKKEESESGPGMLFSSGLIAGGALAGLGIAAIAGFDLEDTFAIGPKILGSLVENKYFALFIFAVLCGILIKIARTRK